MLTPGSLSLTLLLALMTGVGPLSMDMYLASLPSMGRLLQAPTSQVQLTISAYLVGFAVAQIFHGPLSDRHGRRPLLLITMGIYLVATLACIFAFSIETLIAARFVQAVGGSGASVLARAVVRDMYEGSRIGRELARMASIMALAPLVAPVIGGGLETAFGWRSIFLLLFCFGFVVCIMVWFLLPETLRRRAPEPVSIGSIVRSYRHFATTRTFLVHLGITSCCFCGLFAWISSATFIMQDIFHLSALSFGPTFALGSSGYMAGTWIAVRYVTRWGSSRTMGYGTILMASAGILMAILLALTPLGAFGLVAAMCVYLIGMGMTLAQAQAGALLPFPDRAGAASSLLGFVTQTLSAIVGAMMGHVLGTTAWPLVVAVIVAGGLSLLLWFFSRGHH